MPLPWRTGERPHVVPPPSLPSVRTAAGPATPGMPSAARRASVGPVRPSLPPSPPPPPRGTPVGRERIARTASVQALPARHPVGTATGPVARGMASAARRGVERAVPSPVAPVLELGMVSWCGGVGIYFVFLYPLNFFIVSGSGSRTTYPLYRSKTLGSRRNRLYTDLLTVPLVKRSVCNLTQ